MNTKQKAVSAMPARTHLCGSCTHMFPRMSAVRRDGGSHSIRSRHNFRPPPIVEIHVNRGIVFGEAEVARSAKHLICRYADLRRNWLGVIAAAARTHEEFVEAQAFAFRVRVFGRATA